MLLTYYANVYSIISYCLLVYTKGNKTEFDKLLDLHRRILKIIFSTNSSSIDYIMKKHNLMNVHGIYTYKLLCLAHITVHRIDNIPHFLKTFIKTNLI